MAMISKLRWKRSNTDVGDDGKKNVIGNNTQDFSSGVSGVVISGDQQLKNDDDVPYEEEDHGLFAYLSRK